MSRQNNPGDMGELFGIGALVLGGYLLYEYLFAGTAATPVTTSTTTTTPNTSVVNTGVAPQTQPTNSGYTQPTAAEIAAALSPYIVTPTGQQMNATPPPGVYPFVANPSTSLMNTAEALITQAQGLGPFSFDGWNFYYHQLYGVYLAAAAGLNTQSQLISVEQFLEGAGLNGLGNIVTTGQKLYSNNGGRVRRPAQAMSQGYMRR
jgi:hypothetical protein